MKQLLKFITGVLLLAAIIYLSGCSQKISGTVTEVNKDSVITLQVTTLYKFKVKRLPSVGDSATFTPSVVRKKFNSKKVK